MASNQTSNLHLPQWAGEDPFRMAEFNSAFQVLDAAVSARAMIATGSYTGTGVYGADNPTRLAFGFRPLAVVIVMDGSHFEFATGNIILAGQTASYGIRPSGQPGYNSAYCPHWSITWADRAVSWYDTDNAEKQLNVAGARYVWLALGKA